MSGVVVIGGGFSGLTAAVRAAELGLEVTVLERETAERYVNNSRLSSGVANVAAHDITLPAEELAGIVARVTGGHADAALARAYTANAGRAFEWLCAQGFEFAALYPTSNERLSRVIAPPRAWTYGVDWQDKGPDRALARLEERLTVLGGRLLRGARAAALETENGAVTGVETEGETYPAAAVVIADGGFMANRDMIREHITANADKLCVRSAPQIEGDGMRMAVDAGAALTGLGQFYGHLQHIDAMTDDRLWPYPTFDAVAQAALVVGPDGRRFADEGLGGVALTNAVAQLPDPLSAVLVFDEAIWTGGPGLAGPVPANPELQNGGGWMHSADGLAELAGIAGLPADALVSTVAAYNAAVAEELTHKLAPPRTTARFEAHPVVTPPFHAVPLCAGITGNMGGLAIDADARVLDDRGKPIPGLYAVGTTAGGLEGGPNCAYMGGLSKAFIFGLLAAEAMAGDLS